VNLGATELLIILLIIATSVLPIVAVVWFVAKASKGSLPFQPGAAPASPDGWYPDPSGRHQERWDRSGRWTPQARDGADGPIHDDPI
jgi:hypothetical protein